MEYYEKGDLENFGMNNYKFNGKLELFKKICEIMSMCMKME